MTDTMNHPTSGLLDRLANCARRRLPTATLPWFLVLGCLTARRAHANGRLPGATGLAVHPTDANQLLLGLSYGLALSRDGGTSWTWMCEQQIEGNGSDVDPSIVITDDGSLVAVSLTNGGILVSHDDGCTFERAMGPLQGNRGVDLTLDPSQPGRVLALMSTIVGTDEAGHPRFHNLLAQSLNHGRSWEVLTELPDNLFAEAVEVAPSAPNRIYVSGAASEDPLLGIVERSEDGGLTWTRTTTELPYGSGSLFISGIHPSDPDRLWFRVPGRGDIYGLLPARLWLSTDGALSFTQVADTSAGMLGFAVSPDGERVVFGGPVDGLFVAPSDGSEAPTPVSNLQVKCLRWHRNGLYVCAGEPTDAYSLGYAPQPMHDFVPLFQRADTCRPACTEASPLELVCREPWETVAPEIGAARALCDDSAPLLDWEGDGDAAPTATAPEASDRSDSADDDERIPVPDSTLDGDNEAATTGAELAIAPESGQRPASSGRSGGCTVMSCPPGRALWWLLASPLIATWLRRRARLRPKGHGTVARR